MIIYEQNFAGPADRFRSDNPKEIAAWFVTRGLTNHLSMMDDGYYIAFDNNPVRFIEGSNLEKWIQENK